MSVEGPAALTLIFREHFSTEKNSSDQRSVPRYVGTPGNGKNEASEFISSVLDQMLQVSATLNWFPIVIGFATDLGI